MKGKITGKIFYPLTNTAYFETHVVINKTNTKEICRALRQIRRDVGTSCISFVFAQVQTFTHSAVPPFFHKAIALREPYMEFDRAIKYLYRNRCYGTQRAMTHISDNDTPVLNALTALHGRP